MASVDSNQVDEKGPEQTEPEEGHQQGQEAAEQRKSPSQMSHDQARGWSMLCHLSAFAGLIIPLGNVIAPLVFWLIKREESEFVDDQGKEALNFQISLTIYFLVAGILVWLLIGLVLLPIVGIFGIVLVIVAAVKSNQGQKYRYPLCIRFIK